MYYDTLSWFDPVTEAIATWHEFKRHHANLTDRERLEKWRALKRKKRRVILRKYENELLSWKQCVVLRGARGEK